MEGIMPQITLAVIVGNRDFFPDRLVTEARKDIQSLFKELGIDAVLLGETDTKLGAVETGCPLTSIWEAQSMQFFTCFTQGSGTKFCMISGRYQLRNLSCVCFTRE